jgi:hypothetical protein
MAQDQVKFNALLARLAADDPTLTEVKLKAQRLTSIDVAALKQALSTNSHVRSVDLSCNSQVGTEIAALCINLLTTSKTLVSLNISCNGLTLEQMRAIELCLPKSPALQYLDVWGNKHRFAMIFDETKYEVERLYSGPVVTNPQPPTATLFDHARKAFGYKSSKLAGATASAAPEAAEEFDEVLVPERPTLHIRC